MTDDVTGFGIHRPIFKGGDVWQRHRFIFSDGTPVPKNYYRGGDGNNPCATREGTTDPYARAQVLHFSVRTPDMFALKAQRGAGFFTGDEMPPRDAERYARDNRNDESFTEHLCHADAVAAQIDAWMADPDIAKAATNAGHHSAPPKGQSMTHGYPKAPKPPQTDALIEALKPDDVIQICDVGPNLLGAEAAYQEFLAH